MISGCSGANWISPPGPAAPGLRIGLLGGSFNPAHEGHFQISTVALKRLGLDYVWWLVAPQNPLKPRQGMAPLRDRLAGAQAMTRRHPRFRATDIEARLGTRYSVDTIARLQQRFPRLRFVWLMGSDNLETFHRWRNWPKLARSLPIAVVTRPASALAPLKAKAAQRFASKRRVASRDFANAAPPAFVFLDAKRSLARASNIRARRAMAAAFPS